MKKAIIFIFSILISVTLLSQSQYFSDSLYIEELGTLLEPTFRIHPEVEQEYTTFLEHWQGASIDNYKFGIVYVSNSLKDNYGKAYPHFYHYISTLNALIAKNDLNYYTEWEVGLVSVTMSNKIKNIAEYLETSNLLIKDSIISQSPTVTWKTNSTDYEINNDPNTQELYITFKNDFDLTCFNTTGQKVDTIFLQNTKGTCFPIQKKFIGDYGKIPWTQAGLSANQAYATFENYEIPLTVSKITIDSVLFTYTDYNISNEPGNLEIKLNQTGAKDVSPTFISFNNIEINDFFQDVIFSGHIKLQGNKFMGISANQKPAQITINSNGQRVANLKSNSFEIIKDSVIYSVNTNFSFLLNSMQDSIYQQNLIVRYTSSHDTSLFRSALINNINDGPMLIMQRARKGLGTAPFSDTYHQMDLYVEQAIWGKDDSIMYFLTSKESPVDFAAFESHDYFNQSDFDYFSGATTDKFNHLAAIKSLRDENNLDVISASQYQAYVTSKYSRQFPLQSINTLFSQLSRAAFVSYDQYSEEITVLPKLDRYLSNNSRKKFQRSNFDDYDELVVFSKHKDAINAKLNLINNDLKIFNVEPFNITSKLTVYPEGFTVQKNREFNFDGYVGAGLSLYECTHFKFNYDNFDIQFVDTARLRIAVQDSTGKKEKVTTPIDGLQGSIIINDDNNKSNTLPAKDSLPKLITTAKSKIYYNDFAAQFADSTAGVSFNQQFYFEVDEIDLDSLNSLSTELTFSGTMHTGLFDPLKVDSISLKPTGDGQYSLGFTKCTQGDDTLKDGLEFKDGRFFGCFELNDQGLFGNGYIIYHSSYVHCNNFAFLPNQVKGQADTVIIDRQTFASNASEDIPLVTGFNVNFDWLYEMNFKSSSNSNLIMYADKLDNPGDLEGELIYHKDIMYGKGVFKFLDADIIDTNFVFKNSTFDAKTCDFNLKAGNNTTFKTRNLDGHVDINDEVGSFYSNDDTTRIVFDENKYVCIMDHFLWKIGEGIVNIGGVMPGQDTSNYVTSIDDKIAQKQNNNDVKLFGTILMGMIDTLQFNAASTTYKLGQGVIVADDVQKIKIADAMVYPKGEVTILKDGVIDTIKNISFDFPYKVFFPEKKQDYLYNMHNADIVIKNRFDYTAFHALYFYPYQSQEIVFDKVFVENAPKKVKIRTKVDFADLKSFGTKSTKQAIDTIRLNDDFYYDGAGKIKVIADQKHLIFDGFTTFNQTCNNDLMPIKPLHFKEDTINPQNVIMPILPINDSRRGTKVASGLYWGIKRINAKQTYVINYPFVGDLDGYNTIGLDGSKVWPVFQPTGYLKYNTQTGEYRIGSKEIIENGKPDTLNQDMFAYSKNLCLIRAHGTFDLFMPWDVQKNKNLDHVKSDFKGFYRNDLSDDDQEFQGTWAIDFIVPSYILTNLVNIATDANNPSTAANISIFDQSNLTRTRKNYTMFFGKETADQMILDMQNNYSYRLPDTIKNQTFVFSDIQFKYNADSSALLSVGDIGIASINGKPVNRYVKGFVKYRLHQRTRMLIIILEPVPGQVFAFKYYYKGDISRGTMDIYVNTGNNAIDNYITNMKAKDKRIRDYEILDADERTFKTFAPEYF